MDSERALESLGQFGPYQLYVYLIACIPCVICGIIVLGDVFTMAIPKHRYTSNPVI